MQPLILDKKHIITFLYIFLKSYLIIFSFQHILDMLAVLSCTALEIKLHQILLQNGSVCSEIQHNLHGKSKLGPHKNFPAARYSFPFHSLTKYTALYKAAAKSTGPQNNKFSQILARSNTQSNCTVLKNHCHTGLEAGE